MIASRRDATPAWVQRALRHELPTHPRGEVGPAPERRSRTPLTDRLTSRVAVTWPQYRPEVQS